MASAMEKIPTDNHIRSMLDEIPGYARPSSTG
jgi:hypothetical protein